MTGYVTKAALLILIMSSLVVGGWALFFPYEFYSAFPGFVHAWVSVDGPDNLPHFLYHVQHLGTQTPPDQIANVLALGGVLIASIWLLLSTAIMTKP